MMLEMRERVAFTAGEKYAVARAEVQMRRRVCGRLVAEGKMGEAEAARKIAVMQAIAEDYRPRDLFSEDGA